MSRRSETILPIWHFDLTILRLQDGSRAFVQTVIDNFSRYVLVWKVSPDYGGIRTKELLESAIAKATQLGLDMDSHRLCRQLHLLQ